MKTQLLLLPIVLILALSGNFYDSATATVVYNQASISDRTILEDNQFLRDVQLALLAGDESVVDMFLADPGSFLGPVEKATSFNQLYDEWRFYQQIELSAYYRSLVFDS